MSFHEAVLPVNFQDTDADPGTGISFGSSGGPGYRTNIITLDSGAEERQPKWSQSRHRFELRVEPAAYVGLATMIRFYHARGGAENGWRLPWPLDHASNSTGMTWHADTDPAITPLDQVLGTGDGILTSFQLLKRYSWSGGSRIRKIRKPVGPGDPASRADTVRVAVDGVEQVSGTWTWPWSVDPTTGVILFSSPPDPGLTITAGFQFDTPVRFAKSMDDLFAVSADDFASGGIEGIECVELLEESLFPEDYGALGSTYMGMRTSNVAFSLLMGHVLTIQATANIECAMPDPTLLPDGNWNVIIQTTNATSDVVVTNHLATPILTIPPDQAARFWIAENGGGVHEWYGAGP